MRFDTAAFSPPPITGETPKAAANRPPERIPCGGAERPSGIEPAPESSSAMR